MGYELFQKKASRFSAPQLTVRGGKIALNADASDLLAAAGGVFVHIFWDKSANKIAIHPLKKADEDAFKVSARRGNRGATIAAQSFLGYIKWRALGPVVLAAHWDEAARALEATLPKEHVATAEGRRP